MLKQFYPDYYVESTYVINFKKLYEKGYRGLLFDIDNTLVEHGADADERAVKLFEQLKELGFGICLMSNNKLERVERFNKEVNLQYIHKANKPFKKSYLEAMKRLGTDRINTVFIGDQLFTDVWGAKRLGIKNYLVKPINPKEEIQIVLKRYLEKIVLHSYKKYRKSKGKQKDMGTSNEE